MLNNKKFWLAGLAGLTPLLLFFVMNLVTQGNIFPALFSNYLQPVQNNGVAVGPAFDLLNYIPLFLQTIFFILFLIGLVYIILEIFLGYDHLISNQKLRNNFLLFLIMFVFFCFFIFFLKGADDRWLFETLIPLSLFSAIGLDWIYNQISRYNKVIAVILIVVLLCWGIFSQISYADPLIRDKAVSYLQMREAFTWIKDNTPKNAIIVGSGIEPYSIYYADRSYLPSPENETNSSLIFTGDYLVVHGFTPQPSYYNDFINNHNSTLTPVHFELFQGQPIVIIYKISSLNQS